MKDQAQLINCGCGDRLPVRHAAERIAADAVVVDQGIFRDASFFHCFPTVIVADHLDTSAIIILSYM